jgi:hypothetical protein
MNAVEIIAKLKGESLVTCKPDFNGNGIVLTFLDPAALEVEPPRKPGVYVVYQLNPEKPFYIGEAGDLHQRLKYLFRCHRNDNPHPCHKRHEHVYEEMPEVHDFCNRYGVRYFTTEGQWGRLEMEEALQQAFGTNRKEFYMNYDPKALLAQLVPPSEPPKCCAVDCNSMVPCGFCPIRRELSTNPAFRVEEGVEIPTMTGRREPLLFRYEPASQRVRVWRRVGNLDFHFNESACHAICRRFQQGLAEGRNFDHGGAGYFNDPNWPEPVIGRIKTPYAAAVVRSVWLDLGLPRILPT